MASHEHDYKLVEGYETVSPSRTRLHVSCTNKGCPVTAEQHFVRDAESAEHALRPKRIVTCSLGERVVWEMECTDCGAVKQLEYTYERAVLTDESRAALFDREP